MLVSLFLASATTLSTQEVPSPVAVGSRVQLTLTDPSPDRFGVHPPEKWLVGELVRITADTLTVRPHPRLGAVDVSRDAIQRLAVSRGSPSRWRSAAAGAMWGALLGTFWGYLLYDVGLRGPNFDTGAHSRSSGALVGALTIGATSALFPTERWRNVPLP